MMASPDVDPAKTGYNREALLQYLRNCLMPEGGFCSFRDPDSGTGFANVSDTFLALSSFKLLGVAPPGLLKTREWLSNVLGSDGWIRKIPYLPWAISSKTLLGMPVSPSDKGPLCQETENLLTEEVPDFEISSLLHELAFMYHLRLSLDLVPDEGERQILSGFLHRARGDGLDPTILDLADLTSLSALTQDCETDRSEERRYRHFTLGYVLVPGSSRSDLFILLSGLKLRQDPITSEEAESLRVRILFCQERGGGFAPVGGAVPTLEATHAALEILNILSG